MSSIRSSRGQQERQEGASSNVNPNLATFSALHLRDRVVIMLLFDQIVSEERVAEVWTLWKQQAMGQPQEPLWRFLTIIPELDRNLVFGEAARVYGVEEARITRRLALSMIEQFRRTVPDALWEQMVELRLLPIAEATQQHSHRKLVIFATHDPTHPEVLRLMPTLGLSGYELRFAPEHEILGLLADAFPWKYRSLRVLLEEEERLLAPPKPEADHGEAVQEAIVYEPPIHAEPPVELDAPAQVDSPTDNVEEKLLATTVNSSSILSFFEDMLVKAVRKNASGVCIVPNSTGEIEIFFQQGEGLEQWRVVDHIDPNALLATIKSAIIRVDFTKDKETQKEIIKRWIDGALIRFRVSALPSGNVFNLESIVIRRLN